MKIFDFNWNTIDTEDKYIIGMFVFMMINVVFFTGCFVYHGHVESQGYDEDTSNWTKQVPEGYSSAPYGTYAYWEDPSDPRNYESPIGN